MTELWSSNHDAYSHRCRIVIQHKGAGLDRGIGVTIKNIDVNNKPEDLGRLNPYNQVPILLDRDITLFESSIICEYLDERFPHPQLMPSGVTGKGKVRLKIHQFGKELYNHMDRILAAKSAKVNEYRRSLAESLLMLSHGLGRNRFLLGNEMSMVDVALAPLLWRLDLLEIKLPPRAAPLLKYAEIVFSQDSFMGSLTPTEKEMRK